MKESPRPSILRSDRIRRGSCSFIVGMGWGRHKTKSDRRRVSGERGRRSLGYGRTATRSRRPGPGPIHLREPFFHGIEAALEIREPAVQFRDPRVDRPRHRAHHPAHPSSRSPYQGPHVPHLASHHARHRARTWGDIGRCARRTAAVAPLRLGSSPNVGRHRAMRLPPPSRPARNRTRQRAARDATGATPRPPARHRPDGSPGPRGCDQASSPRRRGGRRTRRGQQDRETGPARQRPW